MISIRKFSDIPCILRGGPLDGKVDMLACLDKHGTAPCDTKAYMIDRDANPYIASYRLRRHADEPWEVDVEGRAVLVYEEDNS